MKLNIIFWLIFAMALFTSFMFRIHLPAQDLIVNGEIKFADVDAYYHLMTADYTYNNYPKVEEFTYLLDWPEGQRINQRPLNGFLIATLAKLLNQRVDVVGVYWPAVLGILILFPVLFIGWFIWNKWAGLMASCMLSVIPGEFYGRLSLGVSDQHALEIFLMAFFILFYIMSLRKHWAWSFGAGTSLALYVMNWSGAPALILIILFFVVIQSICNQFKNPAENRMLGLVTFIPLAMSFCMFAFMRSNEMMYMLVYGGAALAPLIIVVTSRYTTKLKPVWYPLFLVAGASLSIFVMWLIFPVYVKYAFWELEGLTGAVGASEGAIGRTISEVQPLLAPYGEFTLSLVIGNFGFIALFGLLGKIVLGFNFRKTENMFILVWAIALLVLTLLQRRYAYYSAVSMSLCSAYFLWWAMDKLGWRKHSKKEVKKKGKPERYFSPVIAVIGAVVLLVAVLIPNGYFTNRETRNHPYMISRGWSDALAYLREKGDRDYGVISWWDYGYWIARDGQMPVPCHPGGGAVERVAKFFTAFTTEEADKIAEGLKSKYVVIDYQMAKHKFYAIPLLAGKGKLTEEQYNNTLLVRLYFSEGGIAGYRQVFESATQYEGQAQVKVYEKYQVLAEPCGCGH